MKNKLILLILPVIMLCLLTGCSGDECTLQTVELPENAEICCLQKNTDRNSFPDRLKGTEIGNYDKDGWRCVYSPWTHDYQDIRLAAVDENGNILKISSVFSVGIKGKNYYWNVIKYNYSENTVTGVELCKIDKGIDNIELFAGCLAPFFYIFLIFSHVLLSYRTYYSYPFVTLFWNIPGLFVAICTFIQGYCDYYSPPEDFGLSDNRTSFEYCCLLLLCINFYGLKKYIKLRRWAKIEKRKE